MDGNLLRVVGVEGGETSGGLDYAMFRWMGPKAGRFLSPDPIHGSLGDGQSWNRFAYAGNDPVNRWDPWGLETKYKVDYVEVVTVSASPITIRDVINNRGYVWMSERAYCALYGVDIFGLPCIDVPTPFRPRAGDDRKEAQSKPPTYFVCFGEARMMEGNKDHVALGKLTAFGTPKQANSTAVIERQWTSGGKGALRPHRGNVFGVVEGRTFDGIDDVMDDRRLRGRTTFERQTFLLNRDPGRLLLEVPDNPKDVTGEGLVYVPGALGGCPEGTSEVGRVE